MGTIISIHIAEEDGAALRPLQEAELVAGRGIVGDRYWDRESGRPKNEVTLVEAEQIELEQAERADVVHLVLGAHLAVDDVERHLVLEGVCPYRNRHPDKFVRLAGSIAGESTRQIMTFSA